MHIKDVENILVKFKDVKVLVIGDIGLDSYVTGSVKRISPEAPVPVVNVENTYHRLGLSANVVNNIKALGGQCELIGVIGSDHNAGFIRDELGILEIKDSGLIIDKERPTTHKTRVLASKIHHVVRIDSESKKPISENIRKEVISKFTPVFFSFWDLLR